MSSLADTRDSNSLTSSPTKVGSTQWVRMKQQRKDHAIATHRILTETFGYFDSSGGWVNLTEHLNNQETLTSTILPHDNLTASFGHRASPTNHSTTFLTEHDDTLEAATSLLEDHGCESCVALNFASAKRKGGGWLSGAQAQEESITRRSTLFSSLNSEPAQPYYKLNLENMKPHGNDGLYTDALVLSKEIAILQRNETNIFEYDSAPKTCAFITSPAPNARHALKCNVTLTKIQEVFKTRLDRVLAVAVAGGYEGLVLGAWGCGVFGNDPQFVASTMMKLLTTKYKNKFKVVSFPLRRDGNKDAFEKAVSRGSNQGRKCG